MIIEKEIVSLVGDRLNLRIMIYDTAQECFEAHFGCPLSEITEMGGCDGNGVEYTFRPEDAITNMVETGCWGFCDNKNTFHIWVAPECQIDNLIHLLAHERGHTIRPYHRSEQKEEIKADRYGETARFAYQVAKQILGLKGEVVELKKCPKKG